MKQPKRLTLESMFNALDNDHQLSDRLYYKDGLGIAIDINRLFKPFVNPAQGPFLLEDYRIGIVKKGYMHGILNLQEYRVEADCAVFVTPGSIVEPLDMSDDFQVKGMGLPPDMLRLALSDKLPDVFNGQMKHGIQKITMGEKKLLDHMFSMLWEITNDKEESGNVISTKDTLPNQQVAYNMIATITSYYNNIFANQIKKTMTPQATAKEIFDRFIYLVNNHCREQRRLAFYAEKICITERYLGTVVRQTSGITAKEWIDKAVMTAAKVMLRHSNRQVAEIADELHFPNASFFCKYFKRLAECTPQEYRQGKSLY